MERASCCSDHTMVKKGPWTPAEDQKLVDYVKRHGHGNWRTLPRRAGLLRCGKSCRLRWTNYLRPDIKRGKFSESEEQAIIQLHALLGNKWSTIAARLPGRTDNEIKNHWNTRLKKRLAAMGIDPHTHLPKVYGSLDSSTASSIGNNLAQLDNVPTVEHESAKLSETESLRLINADRIHRQWNACHLLNRRLQLSNGVMCGGVNSCLQRYGDNSTSILKNTPKQDEVGLLLQKEDALRQEKLPKCKSIRVSDFTDDYDLILSTWQGTCTYMFSTSYNAFDSHHTISYPWPEDRLSAVAENIWKPMPSFASSSSKINRCNGVDSRVLAPGMKSDSSAVSFSPSCEQIVSEYGQNTGDLYCEIAGSATETKWPQKAGASGSMWPHLDYEDANNCYPHAIDYNII